MGIRTGLVIAATIVASVQSAFATTVTLQQGTAGYAGCIDAFITSNSWNPSENGFGPAYNFGNSTELKVHYEGC